MPESALGLSWAYGVSTVKDGVVDLSDAQSDRVFFVASHTAIIQVRIDASALLLPPCPTFAR